MKRYVLTALVLFAALFNAAAGDVTFIDALKYYRDKDLKRAESGFRNEIALHPGNDAAYFYLANTILGKGGKSDADQVEKCYLKAVELDPGNYWYKYMLACFYEDTGRSELATPLLEDLISRFPKKSSLYFDTARAYLRQKDFDNALRCIDKIEASAGKNEMTACSRLDLMIKRDAGNEEKAYEYLTEYYKECRTPRLATMLGDYWQKNFNDTLAISYYNQALAMNDGYAAAYFGRAHSWQGLRRYDRYFADIAKFMTDTEISAGAKSEYLQTVMNNPQFLRAFLPQVDSMVEQARQCHISDSTLNNTVGLYYYRTERPVQAAQVMMQNMNFHPGSFSVGFQYLLLLWYSKAWNRAVEVATILLQRFPSQSEALLVRASSFKELKEYSSAIEDYSAYVAKAPHDSITAVNGYPPLGDAYFYSGQYAKANECYEKALKIVPDESMVLNNYAYFLALQGKNLKKALAMSRKCIAKEPDNPVYLDTYAWILHLLGQDYEAKAIFKHAMLYGGKEEAALLDHYAEVLYSLGEKNLARIYWNQAKSLDRNGTLGIDEKLKSRK